MKKVKLLMMTLMFCFLSLICYGQNENKIIDNKFNITLESGVGEKIPMQFKFSSDAIEKIQQSDIYKNWDSTTFNNPKNTDYIAKWKDLTHFEMFLMSKITMASIYISFELKNRTSYTPISGDGGFIYVNDNNEIVITYPFKAQNGYGNFIMSKGFSITKWDINTMKSVERHFIS